MNRKKVLQDQVPKEIRCRNEEHFPPPNVLPGVIGSWGPLETQRQSRLITDVEYENCKVWERVCGLFEMNKKCVSCESCQEVIRDELNRETYKSFPSHPPYVNPSILFINEEQDS